MKILSFGEIIWDVYPDRECIGGAPLNFAAHAQACGCEATLLSAVGNDELGERAIGELRRLGLSSCGVTRVTDRQTGQCTVALNEDAVPSYTILSNVAYDHVVIPDGLLAKNFDAIAFGTLALRGQGNVALLERLLLEGRCGKRYCDLNLRAPFYTPQTVELCLKYADVLKVSEDELAYLITTFSLPASDTLAQTAEALCRRFALECILLTLGERGAYAYEFATGRLTFQEACPAEVVSTVGAGDCFGAVFLVNRLLGKEIGECLSLAAQKSAFVVSHAEAIPDRI